MNIELDIDSYIDNGKYRREVPEIYIKKSKPNYFYIVECGASLPEFGWKIHISAIPSNAVTILKKVSNYCIEKKITFKFLRDDEILKKTTSKSGDRSSSGKFITIYPMDETSFINTITDLYGMLKNYIGPYVLSDKRYKDCKILYYRYGRIKPKSKKNKNGRLINLLLGPNGEEYIDNPSPFYSKPSWIKDPFEKSEESDGIASGLNNDRYIIKEVLHMSNTGGVYLAYDKKLGINIVLKEARPSLSVIDEDIDSLELRKFEAKMLQELSGISGVPELLNSFYEWEHYFIAVNYIDGETIQDFLSSPKVLEEKMFDKDRSYSRYIDIFIDMVKKINSIHKKGVSIGDLSPYNVLINQLDEVYFLDFELSTSNIIYNKSSRFMSTRGFRMNEVKEDLSNRFEVDIEALGLIILRFFHPTGSFFSLSPRSINEFLNELIDDKIIDNRLAKIIEELIFQSSEVQLENVTAALEKIKNDKQPSFITKNKYEINKINIKKIIEQLYYTINNNMDLSSNSKLFNCTSSFNHYGLYTGDLGILVTLNKLDSILSLNINELIKIYNSHDLSVIDDPYFFSGTAGISYGYSQLGDTQKSIELISKTLVSIKTVPIKYNIAEGIAGIGLVLLHLYKKTKDAYLLEKAIEIGEKIISDFGKYEFNVFINKDKNLELGFYNGLAGISYFLTHLYSYKQLPEFLDTSHLFIKKIINYSSNENKSAYVPIIREGKSFSSSLLGAAGVAKAVFEINIYLKNENLTLFFDKLVNNFSYKYSDNPTYVNGLSGKGLTLLEFYKRTREVKYLNMSEQLLRSILLFKYDNKGNLYFPDSSLLRGNLSYSDGIAGILDFIIEFYFIKFKN
ncbi:lanthionine synthetase LanC family protein [Peribacillus frigoritolerans]|uniref:class III lanthionine synthetase LanKC N-terminal domain-containing protein n=1 Tax=Peribacillus frigoritolerans TaxID=450367 RepID=UPI003D0047B5